jgi:hypothetical protein
MKHVLSLTLCGLALAGCSLFGGSAHKQGLTQKAQWEALGYQEGLKSVKNGM